MANDPKSIPTQSPVTSSSLAERLRVVRKLPEEMRGIRVTLHVSGGVAGQSYTFRFTASGEGDVTCHIRCELSKRDAHTRKSQLSQEEFGDLLDKIRSSKLLELDPEPAGFLPDTVVGCLEITDGRNVYRTYFAADADQARVQNRIVPRPLKRAVDAIYTLGTQLTGLKSVSP